MPVEATPIPQAPEGTRWRTATWEVVEPPEDPNENLLGEWVVTSHLRIPSTTETTRRFVKAAVEYAEEHMECSLLPRTIVATFYDGERLILPRGPILEVQSILDRDDQAVTDYDLKNVGHKTQVVLNRSANYPISIRYRAGYADYTAVPASLTVAILTHVGTLYEARESTSEKTRTVVPHSLEDFYRLKGRGTGIG